MLHRLYRFALGDTLAPSSREHAPSPPTLTCNQMTVPLERHQARGDPGTSVGAAGCDPFDWSGVGVIIDAHVRRSRGGGRWGSGGGVVADAAGGRGRGHLSRRREGEQRSVRRGRSTSAWHIARRARGGPAADTRKRDFLHPNRWDSDNGGYPRNLPSDVIQRAPAVANRDASPPMQVRAVMPRIRCRHHRSAG